MTAPNTGWFRTESGTVLEMDLPLSEPIAQRVKSKEIVRVTRVMKGADERWVPWEEPEGELPTVPDVEAAANMAEVHTELSKVLDRIEELETELEAVTKERDELKAEATKPTKAAKATPAKPDKSE